MIPRPEALADLAIKSTLLLAVGSLAVASLSRRRPALAAACGHAALVGLWLLPLSLFCVPQWNWHILPAEPVPQPLASSIVEPSPEPPALPDFALAFPSPPPPGPLPDIAPEPSPPPIIEPEPLPAAEPWDPFALALAAYATVSGLFLLRLAFALLAVRRLVLRSTHVLDPTWTAALAELNAKRNHVQFLWSDRLSVPVVVGWLRPAILLPTHLQASDPCTARAVLLHELAHIHRRDYPWNVFLRLTLSLYWPHPLAWLLSRTLSESRENACDAYCVHALGGPAPYADALLSVVSLRLHSSIPTPSLGLAMARPSRLRSRLARIATTTGAPTVTPSLPSRILLLLLTLPLSALLGPLHLAPAQAEPIVQPIPAQKPVDPPTPAGRTLTLRVVSAETGKPLPKPEARAYIGVDELRLTGDQDGILKIPHSSGLGDRTVTIDLAAPGHALQRHAYGRSPIVPIPDEVTIKLQPGETLGGVAQDEQGRPVAGAEILLWSQNYTRKDPSELLFDLRAVSGPDGRWQTTSAPQTNGEIFGYKVRHPDYISDLRTVDTGDALPTIADLRAGKAVIVLKKGVPIEGRVTDAEDRPIEGATVLATKAPDMVFEDFRASRVKTDATGRFRHGQVKPGDWYVLVQSKDHAPARAAVTIGTSIPRLSFTLRQGRTYRGRVIDPQGKPIAGALVGVDSWDGFKGLFLRTWSDAEGRFRFDQLPRGEVSGRVEAIGYIGSLFKVEDQAEEKVFRLQRILTISGRVRDAETGKAIPRGRVEFGKPDPKTGEVGSWLEVASSPNPLFQGFLNVGLTAEVESCRLRIIVDGYAPVVSRVFKVDEVVVNDYDVSLTPLRPGEAPTAVVTASDGKPLVGARVHTLQPVILNTVDAGSLVLQSTTAPRESRTDKEGRFVLPFASGLLLILGDREFAILSQKEVAAQANKIQAMPYAKVEGRLLRAGRPMPNRPVRLQGTLRREDVQPGLQVSVESEAMTDAEGRFVFEKVLPLPTLRVKMADGIENGIERRSQGKPIHPRPGETLRVEVGGGGRSVVGLAALPDNMPQPVSFSQYGKVCLTNGSDRIPYPLSVLRGTTKLNFPALTEWKRAWDASPEARAIEDRWRVDRQSLELDGSFRLDDVPPGRYQLWLSYGETDGTKAKQPPLTLLRDVTVPEWPSETPLDLGTLLFESMPVAQIGRPAPVVRATGLDGKPVTTESYKGKYVVVSFETISTPARLKIPDLNALHAKRREDPRVAFLSVILAPDDDATRRYAREKGQPWTQAIHPPNPAWMSSPFFPRDHYYLIAPDGTLASRALDPSDLEKFLPALPENPQEKPQPAPTKPQASTAKPAGREFTLRVVSAETGKPVADADVRLSFSLMYEMRKTDADGVLKIRHSTGPADRMFGLEVIAKGFALQRRGYLIGSTEPIPDGETVRLRPGETLGGFVKDEQGRPISGALVKLWSHNYKPSDPNEMMYDLPAVSGPDGRWETSSAPKTTGELIGIRCIHPDFVSIRDFSKESAPSIADLRAGKGIIVLEKGIRIEGRVTDKDGKPVAGAEVVGAPRSESLKIQDLVDIVCTDADGRYRLGQVKPGPYSVVVQSKNHAPAAETIQVGMEAQPLDFVLDPPNVLRGRVVDPDGKPLAWAQVILDSWNNYRFLGKVWWTDQDGRFVWENGPKAGAKVSISRTGFDYISRGDFSAQTEEQVYKLRPTITLYGALKDSVTGKPIKSGLIEYRSFDRKTNAPSVWTRQVIGQSLRPVNVGSVNEERYRVDIYIEKEADVYQFRIQADGYEEYISEELRYDVPYRSQDIKLQPRGGGGQ